jgi:hypothetical protein
MPPSSEKLAENIEIDIAHESLMHTDHRIKYYATQLVRSSITKKLCALVSMEEEEFANYFDIHDLEFDTWNDIASLEVKPIFSPHPVETSILIFRAKLRRTECRR